MNLIQKPYPVHLALRGIAPVARLMPKALMNLRYRLKSGRFIKWSDPQNLQEFALKKLFDAAGDKKILKTYADLSDKVLARDFVKDRVGEEMLTRLYGVWERPDDIDFDKLPVPCVIKTNNGCTTNIIVRDRKDLNPDIIVPKLKKWLKFPYGALTGQPHYSEIKPLILAEEYLDQNPGSDDLPFDYKFFCFNGEPHFILFYSGRKLNSHLTYDLVYDTEWKLMEGVVRNPRTEEMPRPEAFDRMLEIARKLCKGFDFVRVDLYAIGKRVVFGEMTFTPDMVTNFTPEFLSGYFKKIGAELA